MNDVLCWITMVLVCMSGVVWNPSWFPDYRDYGSLRTGIWSLRWLFLYLHSYNLVGSVTCPVMIFPLWDLTRNDRTLALSVRSLHLSASGRARWNHLGQMNWPDPEPASGQYLTLHSLPTLDLIWMKFAPLDLRAILELPSARFSKCAPHRTH